MSSYFGAGEEGRAITGTFSVVELTDHDDDFTASMPRGGSSSSTAVTSDDEDAEDVDDAMPSVPDLWTSAVCRGAELQLGALLKRTLKEIGLGFTST